MLWYHAPWLRVVGTKSTVYYLLRLRLLMLYMMHHCWSHTGRHSWMLGHLCVPLHLVRLLVPKGHFWIVVMQIHAMGLTNTTIKGRSNTIAL